jgi:voltage-gated potassium channel
VTWLRRFRAEGGYQRWDRSAEWPLVVLGLLFLVILILPLAEPLSEDQSHALDVANVAIWAVFVIDYFTRLYLAPSRRQFVRTHILDLIVIAVPFLRPFRILRLFAIVVSTTRRAGGLAVRQVTLYVVAVAVIITSTAAVVVYDAERQGTGSIKTLGDAFWWAFATVTSVGYGDAVPTTQVGRWVAVVLMITGIALIGTITAAVASWFVNIVRTASTADADDDDDEHTDAMKALQAQVAELTTEARALRTEIATTTSAFVAGAGSRDKGTS